MSLNNAPCSSTPIKGPRCLNLLDDSTDSVASSLSLPSPPKSRHNMDQTIDLLDYSNTSDNSQDKQPSQLTICLYESTSTEHDLDDNEGESLIVYDDDTQPLSSGKRQNTEIQGYPDDILSLSPIKRTRKGLVNESQVLSLTDDEENITISKQHENMSPGGSSVDYDKTVTSVSNYQETKTQGFSLIDVDDDEDELVTTNLKDPELKQPRDVRIRTNEEIMWLFTIPCCEKRCLHKLSIGDIHDVEVVLKERTQTEKRNYLLEFLHQHSTLDDSGEYNVNYIIKGRHVCREAWLLAHNIPKNSFWRLLTKFKDGAMRVEHGNKGKRSIMPKTGECIAWLQYFFNTIGDHMPDSNAIHLPSCFSKSDVYRKLHEENSSFNQPTVSLSHFYSIWEQHFSHVTIPKENRFTKCTECTRFKNLKEKHPSLRDTINSELNEHLDLVWQERRVYYLHRYKARKFPHKYLTIIDDGMDQQTTNIPKVRRLSKAISGLTNVGTHLVGAIVHSGQSPHGKEIFGSFDYYQWKHDANLSMTVLLNTLMKWCENYKLPPILYLQMDNCWKENKNQFMMALLGLMVQMKIFEKIRLNFLPVGHTHEDIDAFFGVFSKHLGKCDVYTTDDLRTALESCMTNPRPKSFLLPHSYNIKDWITGNAFPMRDHTKPKSFKFENNSDGEVVMMYRNWSHEDWFGPFKLLKSVPTGKPELVEPHFEKLDPDALLRDLPKYSGHIPEVACAFWKTWVENIEELLSVPPTYEWPLEVVTNAVRTEPLPAVQEVLLDLRAIREKELEPTREIYTGPYRSRTDRQNPVERSDNWLNELKEGSFVAMIFENYNAYPVIGKVLELSDETFKVHYWKGTYNGKWVPQHLPRQKQEPWVEWLPKTCIVCCNFSLTDKGKLAPPTRDYLKTTYKDLKVNGDS